MKYLLLIIVLWSFCSIKGQNLQTPTLSPYSEIKQEVGLTEISLSYARPSANGRRIFGELVPYGEIWRTGANASTKLTVSETVSIAGNSLPAGTFAIYTIPGPQEWTIIIHKKTDMRSIAGDQVKAENDAFRFTVTPINNPLTVETFTIQFTDITSQSCQVQLAWENTVVKFPIEVEVGTKIEAQMTELMKNPDQVSHQVYFRAAEYYLHNQQDLAQAMHWIDAALVKSPENFRYGLLKAKLYAAQGKHQMAISTVQSAHDWATTAKNANYMEQTSLYLASLKPGIEQGQGAVNPLQRYQADVSSLDQILKALYASISGEKGEKRDWDRFEHLFIPEARLIPSSKNDKGKTGYRIMSPQEYVQNSGKWLEENGFFEVEISREVVEYGSLVHVFSTYESYRSQADEEPFARGINSIQLLHDEDRWWVVQIYWLGETEKLPLPMKYLPKK